ncbi:hypothetical protein N7478_013028 [Penicillium angulare]|uniref:uncharacterized protein n=1 Tax=Penicillium angulare TaxID=116970 RepID=UPI0025405B9C|nr:uncharacterized protein N7478_013028 [Penicillium angulare]KAJ5256924.1 hypothetical protein N7478_013028 [Penicillium angulare]
MVLIHSSQRNAPEMRKTFAPFAKKHSYMILSPLFPVETGDFQDTAGYKVLKSGEIRYDLVLLSMVEEVYMRYTELDVNRFLLFGFSGGGQFVHRFAYLYTERLKAVVCGAPGSKTFPDDTKPYPQGVKDLERVFGLRMQWKQLCTAPTLFIVGDAHTSILYTKARGKWIEVAEEGRYGGIVRLEAAWRTAGARCKLNVVPGVSHEMNRMMNYAEAFFEEHQ